jgi:DNA-binding MarR family transcriptional regulator
MPPRRKSSKVPLPDTITDPVEWAHVYWQSQHLEGDEQRFLAMGSLLRYQRIVVDAVEAELRQFSLNLTDYLMIMTLQLSKNGTRLISSLARNLMIHATTATLATDRLEERGLVIRQPHPTDRRATCITITEVGRDMAQKTTLALSAIDFGLVGSDATIKKLLTVLSQLRNAAGDADTFPRSASSGVVNV